MDAVFEGLSAGDVQIGKSVVVVVEPDATRTGAFEKRTEFLRSEAVRELNSGICGRVFKLDCAGSVTGDVCASEEEARRSSAISRIITACLRKREERMGRPWQQGWSISAVSTEPRSPGRFQGQRGIQHILAARRVASRRIRIRASMFCLRCRAVRFEAARRQEPGRKKIRLSRRAQSRAGSHFRLRCSCTGGPNLSSRVRTDISTCRRSSKAGWRSPSHADLTDDVSESAAARSLSAARDSYLGWKPRSRVLGRP